MLERRAPSASSLALLSLCTMLGACGRCVPLRHDPPGPTPAVAAPDVTDSRAVDEHLERLRTFAMTQPLEEAVADREVLRDAHTEELVRAAASGRLRVPDVASFARSADARALAEIERAASLPSGFFRVAVRLDHFPDGYPFVGRPPANADEDARLRRALRERLTAVATVHRERGGTAFPIAVPLLTGTTRLPAPRTNGPIDDRTMVTRAVDAIPSMELEARHARLITKSADEILAAMPTRDALAGLEDLISLDHLIGTLGRRTGDALAIALHAENVPTEDQLVRFVALAPGARGEHRLDDVARAAVVLLQQWRRRPTDALLSDALSALRFVRLMQAEDGEFYELASIRGDRLVVHREDDGAHEALGFAATRAMWALGEGFAAVQERDRDEADALRAALLRTLPRLEEPLSRYGEHIEGTEHRLPAWLLNDATDQTAVAIEGLLSWHDALPDGDERERVRSAIERYADGIAAARVIDPAAPDRGRFIHDVTEPDETRLWGSHQVAALARAGRSLGRRDWIDAAADCARFHWGERQPSQLIGPGEPQVAYAIEVVVSGYARLFEATNDAQWAAAAERWAAWLFGENDAEAIVYDPTSGRGYDGITPAPEDETSVLHVLDAASGADATVESLLALQSAARIPGLHERLRSRLSDRLPRASD